MIAHAFTAASARASPLSDSARELLSRASRGVPRLASHLLPGRGRDPRTRARHAADLHLVELVLDPDFVVIGEEQRYE